MSAVLKNLTDYREDPVAGLVEAMITHLGEDAARPAASVVGGKLYPFVSPIRSQALWLAQVHGFKPETATASV